MWRAARRARAGLRINCARGEQGDQRARRRKSEAQESRSEVLRFRDCHRHHERADHCAGLVHRGVQAEAPAVADLAGGFRKQHVARGAAQTLAGALDHYQQSRHLPIAHECHRRYDNQVQAISEDGEAPISARAVDKLT